MRHDGDHAADPPANEGGEAKGTASFLETIGSVANKLAPNVPAATAGVVLLAVLGIGAIAVLAPFVETEVLLIVAALVVAGIGASVVVLLRDRDRDGAPPDPPAAPGDTLSVARDLSPTQHDAVCQIVGAAVADVADVLGADATALRGNVFGSDGNGTLRIMPEFDHNMTYVKERSLSMPIGQGSNGRAWATGRPNIAIRQGGEWGPNAMPIDQEDRLVEGLSWVISVPVFPSAKPPPPTWVLNVDGVDDTRSLDELSLAVGKVMLWATQLGRVLDGVPRMAGGRA